MHRGLVDGQGATGLDCAERRSHRAPADTGWLETALQIAPAGIFRVDPQGLCRYVNARWCEITGISAEEALGRPWTTGIHPEDVPLIREAWHSARRGAGPLRVEFRILRGNGQVVWTLGQAAEEHDAAGTLLGYVGVITDVTAEHRAQEALRHANSELELRVHERTAELQQMALIVENSDDAIISADYEGIIRSWNPAAETMFGYSAEEMIGRESTAILTPAERLDESRELKRRVRAGETISHHETVRVSRTGELIEVAISLNPLRGAAGQIYGTFAVVRDITERKKAERSLQQLSGRLLRLQDEERRRVARELHDSTSQTLAGLSLNLAVLNRGFDTMPAPRRAEILADSLGLAESAARDLRTHAYLLHPPLLDERGLAAAVRWFVEGFSARSNIAVQLKISPRFPRLAEQIETTIFRVVQESLTNVHRHAQSATATIRLAARGGWITLEIRDRGRGLPAESQEELGVGIAGMKERLRQLRGTLTIQSSRRGTVVRARLPR